MTSLSREASAVDAIAEDYMTKLAALDPFGATAIGIPGYDHLVTDLSPAGLSARAELDRATLSALDSVDPTDEIDAVSIAAMRERLGLAVETFESGWAHADLNNIASPLQGMRDLFDLQPVATVQDWENIASRLSLLPTSLAGYIESLRFGAASGKVPAKLQVTLGAVEARENANEDETFFLKFVTSDDATKIIETSENAADLGARLKDAALATARAYGELADFLETELLPQAPEKDAAGRERYELASRQFLGATIDLDETYEWGLAELARIVAEQQAIAEELYGPGTTVEQAVENLDKDDRYILRSKDELKAWMQETADKAIRELNGVHFDIPDPVQTIECMIAPTQTGGIYYTPPTDDFSRAGRMWWSVPPSVTTFNTWREKTTVFHEGVPGHHLQCAQAVYLRDTLNSWRRLACWVSGHGEGWALYSERLMEDLGYLEDPADRLGMLDGQRLRAARVVLDIGVHLEKPCPEEWGGGIWDSEKAWEFLKANVNMPEAFVRFELNRYLGWPGQAPSYKVGQRLWEQIREDARAAAEARGEEFSLKDFHERALALGSVGLDVLGEALAG
ncbi:DUF885 domain-containing protein [Timonella senegalensis]|uniref:DUF885 domain-containing protein n=1 Tax=Timonella senegalensis TaxID=1465825 RepID=UPI0028A77887|nr:DUF885 domain-containing protein [Timonella senegalensis]